MRRPSARGSMIVYLTSTTIALIALISLGVDWGRVIVARNELQTATDAAARYGVTSMRNEISGASAGPSAAASIALQNKCDGSSVVLDKTTDVDLGIWNNTTRVFTVTTDSYAANAMRVTARRSKARGTAIPTIFGAIIGRASVDISAQAIAVIDYSSAGAAAAANGGMFDYYVPATSNPWLSGQPSGTVANSGNPHNNPDYAGTNYKDTGAKMDKTKTAAEILADRGQSNSSYTAKKASPIQAGGMTVSDGMSLTFDSISGGATNDFNDSARYTADGNTGQVEHNINGSENGISDLTAPINSVIAVFLDDTTPGSSGSTPATLDFSTTTSRDFDMLKPKLRQMFYVGDGRNSDGDVQQFVVPTGATRLFIGTMDGYEWNNNVGAFVVSAHVTGKVRMVK